MLHLGIVHANQFFIERYREGGFTTEFGHISPLSLTDGLFDAVDGILRQEFQFIQSFLKLKCPVGIKPKLHLMEREPVTYAFDEIELLLEIDGTNLEFHTAETLFQFLFHALEHLVVVAHPHKTVDGDTHLAPRKSRIKENTLLLTLQIHYCRLETEEHRGISAYRFIVNLTCFTQRLAEVIEHFRIVGTGVTTQIGQWSTLPHSLTLTVGEIHKPTLSGGIDTTRGSCGLLEMERSLFDMIGHGILGYFLKSGLRFSRKALPPSWASSRK